MHEIPSNGPLFHAQRPDIRPTEVRSGRDHPEAANPTTQPVSTEHTAPVQWIERLEKLPQIRPEMVARGRELIAESSYPGPDVVRRSAEIIVGQLLS